MKRSMKKSFLFILCLLLLPLLACGEEKTVPDPQVEAFLNTELSGEKAVEAGIVQGEVTLKRRAEGCIYTTRQNEAVKEETVEDTFAADYINSFFFTDNGAYKEGGLYYGDFFLLYIYKYPASSFFVEGDTCVFDEKMEVYEGDGLPVLLHQRAVIDKYGLLQQEYERFESQEQDMVLVSALQASYEYKE